MKTEPLRTQWHSPDPPALVPRPMLIQSWRQCGFLHWRVDPSSLRDLVPPEFEIETCDGSAWVSVIPFDMPHLRFGGLPPVPGLASAVETHIRTYVQGPDGRSGIWMTSLEIDPIAAAIGGRIPFALPYWWATASVERDGNLVRYRTQRRLARRARFELDLRVGEPYANDELTELDHFLTARWVLYSGAGPLRSAIVVEHPRWPLRRATLVRLKENLTSSDGLPRLIGEPLVHFSDGVDAKLSWPKPFLGRR